MHSAILILLSEAARPAESAPSSVKIALIGALAIVIAAAIPALLSLRERIPKEIRQRLERESAGDLFDISELHDRIHDLERFIWLLGYDPDTFLRVRETEMDDDDA